MMYDLFVFSNHTSYIINHKFESFMVMKRSALGRGLDALITMDDLKTGGSSSISEIELSKIQPNPDQPRSVFEE